MRTILSIAAYEFRVMLSLRLTPLVVGVAWMLILLQLWFADNSSHGVNTLAGEWSGWARVCGPLAQLGIALIAVWAGAARVDTLRRDARGQSISALPVRPTSWRFGVLTGRLLFATVAVLLPLLPLGWVHATAGVSSAMTDFSQLATVAIAVTVAIAYLVTGTYLLAQLVPRTWVSVLIGLALSLVWLGGAWFAFNFGMPALDRTLFATATSVNPFWLVRCASLGLLPGMGIAVAIGALAHLLIALRVANLIVHEYDFQQEKHRLRYRKMQLVVTLVPAGLALAGLCVAGVFLRPLAIDMTRAEVTKPGPRAHEILHVEAWIDPVNRFDGPLLAHYLERLKDVSGTTHQRIWHPAPHRRGWVGVDLTNVADDQRVVIDIRGTLAASPWLLDDSTDETADPDIRRLPGGAALLTAFETLALGVADHAEWTDDAGKSHRPRGRVVVVGADAGRPLRTFLRSEGYRVDTLGTVALESATRLRTVALINSRSDLTPDQLKVITEFQQQGGAVLVMLPSEKALTPSASTVGDFELPTIANGLLPVPDTQLARLLAGWGIRCAPARWTCPEDQATPCTVTDVLGYEHWKSIASEDALSWPDSRSGDVNVAVVVRHWAAEFDAAPGEDGAPRWVPLVTAEAAMLAVPGDGPVIELRATAVWIRPGDQHQGPVALSAIEPFARAGLEGRRTQPALIGDDERDLLGNLVARLADRPPSARTQRRKPLVTALPGVGLDRDWVAFHQVAAYIVLALGLALTILRSRRKHF